MLHYRTLTTSTPCDADPQHVTKKPMHNLGFHGVGVAHPKSLAYTLDLTEQANIN